MAVVEKNNATFSPSFFCNKISGRNQGDSVSWAELAIQWQWVVILPRTLKTTLSAATSVVTGDATAINSIFLPTPDSNQLTRSSNLKSTYNLL